MKNAWTFLMLAMTVALWAAVADGQQTDETQADDTGQKAFVLDVQGAIGPATRDFIFRSLETATEQGAGLLVIRLDTPGGLDASTRDIIKDILNSAIPVAIYVAPEGARAASAGTYMLYASHIAAMSPATNVGAATPVAMIGGAEPPGRKPKADSDKDEEEDSEAKDAPEPPADAMMRKTINDSVAYIRGLAQLRGRNAEWAEDAVRKAVSITSEEALELGVIDVIAKDLSAMLASIDGMTVEVRGQEWEIKTAGAVVERLEPDWRNELLSTITSPTIAYILLLVGVYGLILEGYNPGAILPGVVGAISLLLALYALQMLPVNYAGLALIALGIILMIAEVMAPSFGVLGFGGIIAMVIGSIILIDTDVPGFAVSRALIGSIATFASLGLMAIIAFAIKARQRPVVSGREQLIGATGEAVHAFKQAGEVWVHGERWSAVSEAPVKKGQVVVVTGLDGLVLHVRPTDQ